MPVTKIETTRRADPITPHRARNDRGASWTARADVGKVSAIAACVESHSGLAAETFATPGREKIAPAVVSPPPGKIGCHLETCEVDRAVKALHDAFDLA